MSAHEVMVWSVTPGLLSEGPHWHEEHQELLWVDILGRQMHRGTLTPMTPWNVLRQSRSTGTSARSRLLLGAGTNCCRKEDIAATPLSAKPPIPTAVSRRRSPPQGPRDRRT